MTYTSLQEMFAADLNVVSEHLKRRQNLMKEASFLIYEAITYDEVTSNPKADPKVVAIARDNLRNAVRAFKREVGQLEGSSQEEKK